MPPQVEPVGARKRRALLIVPLYACARNTGGGQRTFHLYESLRRFCEVDVLLVSQPETASLESGYPDFFRGAFPQAAAIHLLRSRTSARWLPGKLAPWFDRLRLALEPRDLVYRPAARACRRLDELMGQSRYDVVVGRYLLPTSRAGALRRDDVPVLVDVDDRDDKVIESRLAAPTTPALAKPLLRWHLARTRAVMAAQLGRCAHLWLASEADRDEVQHASKSVLPNIPYVEPHGESDSAVPAPAAGRTLLFVGTYMHRVNREGVLRFVQTCWPPIRRAVPDACFRVVGSGGWSGLRDKLEAQPGVTVVGTVTDLAREYAQAAFSVVPLLEGSGTKIKVLESLRFMRTVVAHVHAARGFDLLRHGESLLVADTDGAMVEQCIALLNDAGLRHALAARGHAVVSHEYSLPRFAAIVFEDVAAAIDSARAATASS
jgi:glycosyltransferase involved in cell wall biosynthesis